MEGGKAVHVSGESLGPFPSLVGLSIQQSSALGVCTGAFIADNLLVTAAHCFDPFNREAQIDLTLMLSNGTLASSAVAAVHIKPGYLPLCAGLCSDVAIIEIAPSALDAIAIKKYSRAAEIATSSPAVGDKVILTGFGCQKMDALTRCEDRETFYDHFWKYQIAPVVLKSHPLNPSSDLYFGTDGADARNAPGDSGGPIYDREGRIAGVNAFRLTFHYFDNNYHTRLTAPAVREWIDEIIRSHGRPIVSDEGTYLPPEMIDGSYNNCVYVKSLTQSWRNSSYSTCPLEAGNETSYNSFLVNDRYMCGREDWDRATILSRGNKMTLVSFECLTKDFHSKQVVSGW